MERLHEVGDIFLAYWSWHYTRACGELFRAIKGKVSFLPIFLSVPLSFLFFLIAIILWLCFPLIVLGIFAAGISIIIKVKL